MKTPQIQGKQPRPPVLPFDTAKRVVVATVSDWESLSGTSSLPPLLAKFNAPMTRLIRNLSIHDYPKLYEDEKRIVGAWLLAFLTPQEIKEFSMEVEQASLEERGQLVEEFEVSADSFIDSLSFPRTHREMVAARREFRALSIEVQRESIRVCRFFFSGLIATFHQTLSILVHGEKLTSLVAKAKAGDRMAFMKAIQIDPRILDVVPFFVKRHERARLEMDQDFRSEIFYRTVTAPHQGRIRNRSLWMTMSLLDGMGWLAPLSNRQFLSVLDEIGSAAFEFADETGIGKYRRNYLLYNGAT